MAFRHFSVLDCPTRHRRLHALERVFQSIPFNREPLDSRPGLVEVRRERLESRAGGHADDVGRRPRHGRSGREQLMGVVSKDAVEGPRHVPTGKVRVDQRLVGRRAEPHGDVEGKVHGRELPVAAEVLERVVLDAVGDERGVVVLHGERLEASAFFDRVALDEEE